MAEPSFSHAPLSHDQTPPARISHAYILRAHVPHNAFAAQYRRVFEAAECSTQSALAKVLGIRQSSISDAKRREALPAEWLVKLLTKKGINPEWILYGSRAKYILPADALATKPHAVTITQVRPPRDCSAQELVNELVRRAMEQPDIAAGNKKSLAVFCLRRIQPRKRQGRQQRRQTCTGRLCALKNQIQ